MNCCRHTSHFFALLIRTYFQYRVQFPHFYSHQNGRTYPLTTPPPLLCSLGPPPCPHPTLPHRGTFYARVTGEINFLPERPTQGSIGLTGTAGPQKQTPNLLQLTKRSSTTREGCKRENMMGLIILDTRFDGKI